MRIAGWSETRRGGNGLASPTKLPKFATPKYATPKFTDSSLTGANVRWRIAGRERFRPASCHIQETAQDREESEMRMRQSSRPSIARLIVDCLADRRLLGGGNPHTKLHRLWLLQLRPDQVHDSQSQGLPPPSKKQSNRESYGRSVCSKTTHAAFSGVGRYGPDLRPLWTFCGCRDSR